MTQQDFQRPNLLRKSIFLATFIVAVYAVSTDVLAQNASVNSLKIAPEGARVDNPQEQLLAERQRIAGLRAEAIAVYAAQRKDCYQRFSVNGCLTEARDGHNAQIADLKRQEISLDDSERKRKGAEKIQRIQDKTSPELLKQQAQRRSQSLENEALRQQRAQSKAVTSDTPSANAQPTTKLEKPKKTVQNGQSKLAAAQKKAEARASKTAQAALNKAHYEQRLTEAAAHEARLKKKLTEKTKPASAGLTVPP